MVYGTDRYQIAFVFWSDVSTGSFGHSSNMQNAFHFAHCIADVSLDNDSKGLLLLSRQSGFPSGERGELYTFVNKNTKLKKKNTTFPKNIRK